MQRTPKVKEILSFSFTWRRMRRRGKKSPTCGTSLMWSLILLSGSPVTTFLHLLLAPPLALSLACFPAPLLVITTQRVPEELESIVFTNTATTPTACLPPEASLARRPGSVGRGGAVVWGVGWVSRQCYCPGVFCAQVVGVLGHGGPVGGLSFLFR